MVLVACLAGAASGACGGGERAGIPEAVVRDSAGVRILENQLPAGPLPVYATVSGEPEWSLDEPRDGVPGWSSVRIRGAVTLSDGRVAVGDAGSFRVRYYEEGELTWSVGGRGSGPGRFMGVFTLGRTPGDTVWVSDHVSHDLTLLDPDAVESLEGRVPGEASVVGRFGDGSFLTLRDLDQLASDRAPLGVRRDSAEYLRWWPETGDSARVGSFPAAQQLVLETGAGERIQLPPPFGRGTGLAVGPGRIYLGDQERFEILGMDADGTLRQIVRLQGLDRTVTPEAMEALSLVDESGLQPEWAQEFWAHAPETLPAFGRIVLDALGNLWVSDYVITGEPPRRWLVFSPDGALRGRVEVPAGLTVLEIGMSHLLGVTRGEGVPQEVRRYGLERR